MVDSAKFWDKHAAGYAKSPIRNQNEYERKLEVTRRYFTPDSDVFEFACGTGSTAIAHAPYVKHIAAIDISAKMVEIAQGKADAADISNLHFEQNTIEAFETNGRQFDVVMAHNILHLLVDPAASIKKVRGMLKPGGMFVTSTVCLGNGLNIWRLLIPPARLFGLAPFVNVFSQAQLERFFIDAGFEFELKSEPEKGKAAFMILKNPG